ncbi:MAG: hypothetical protein AMS27_12405 [Bacteroides sp. SM23_62_1]|nr:MAG: hypothetical protein AMS27_12405 [Bacteroides sp. SM23_62_1]
MALLLKKKVQEEYSYLQDTQIIGSALGVTWHLIYLIYFAIFDIDILFWFNLIISVPVFIIALALCYKGVLKVPPIITSAEVAIHQVLASLLLGQDTGFPVILFCLIPIGILFKNIRISFPTNSLIAFILFLAISWFDTGQFISYQLPENALKMIKFINCLGLFLIVGLIIFYYITLNKKLYNKQKETSEKLSKSYQELDIQHRNITESIHYAEKIQTAILPEQKLMDELMPEYFVLFKPRDIVSGDFYWVSQVKQKIIFCIADCTGHGVPGAFMSLLGITFLDDIVNQRNVLSSNEILNNLRKELIKALKQTGKVKEQKEGMDIALCQYDKKTSRLEYAGANNPLYHIRNGVFEEFKADRMSIGYEENISGPFRLHTFQIKKGDIIYLFSDGYADQFGGPDGKKFKYGGLKKYLLEIHEMPMGMQKMLLEENFCSWKGDREQIDDVILMGVRF